MLREKRSKQSLFFIAAATFTLLLREPEVLC
jgi:hypothetical protein